MTKDTKQIKEISNLDYVDNNLHEGLSAFSSNHIKQAQSIIKKAKKDNRNIKAYVTQKGEIVLAENNGIIGKINQKGFSKADVRNIVSDPSTWALMAIPEAKIAKLGFKALSPAVKKAGILGAELGLTEAGKEVGANISSGNKLSKDTLKAGVSGAVTGAIGIPIINKIGKLGTSSVKNIYNKINNKVKGKIPKTANDLFKEASEQGKDISLLDNTTKKIFMKRKLRQMNPLQSSKEKIIHEQEEKSLNIPRTEIEKAEKFAKSGLLGKQFYDTQMIIDKKKLTDSLKKLPFSYSNNININKQLENQTFKKIIPELTNEKINSLKDLPHGLLGDIQYGNKLFKTIKDTKELSKININNLYTKAKEGLTAKRLYKSELDLLKKKVNKYFAKLKYGEANSSFAREFRKSLFFLNKKGGAKVKNFNDIEEVLRQQITAIESKLINPLKGNKLDAIEQDVITGTKSTIDKFLKANTPRKDYKALENARNAFNLHNTRFNAFKSRDIQNSIGSIMQKLETGDISPTQFIKNLYSGENSTQQNELYNHLFDANNGILNTVKNELKTIMSKELKKSIESIPNLLKVSYLAKLMFDKEIGHMNIKTMLTNKEKLINSELSHKIFTNEERKSILNSMNDLEKIVNTIPIMQNMNVVNFFEMLLGAGATFPLAGATVSRLNQTITKFSMRKKYKNLIKNRLQELHPEKNTLKYPLQTIGSKIIGNLAIKNLQREINADE